MGWSQKRLTKGGRARYRACYRDIRGEIQTAGTFSSERAADKAWQKAEAKLAEGRIADPRRGRQTFHRYVTEEWLPHHVIEVTTREAYTYTITRTDMHHMQAAAAASQIYSPARHQPENRDRVHVYRYCPATTDQIANLLTTYADAVAATNQATATLDNLLTTYDRPGDSHSLARAIGHTPASPQHRQHAIPPEQRPRTATSRPEVTGLERLLHDLNISDPELLLRATALDHATRALAAEAVTNALNRTAATQEFKRSPYNYSRPARLAAQDSPVATRALTRVTETQDSATMAVQQHVIPISARGQARK